METRPIPPNPPAPRAATPSRPPAGGEPEDRFVPGAAPAGLDLAGAARALARSAPAAWESRVTVRFGSVAVGSDGSLYGGNFDHHVYRLDPRTGETVWSYKTDSHLDDAPALSPDGTRLYATSRDLHLHILQADGRPLRKVRVGPTLCGPAVGPDGGVYLGTFDAHVKAYSPEGDLRWDVDLKHEGDPGYHAPPAFLPDGTVVAASFGHVVAAFDAASGDEKWRVKADGAVSARPQVGPDGRIYLGTFGHTVQCLDPATGRTLWSRRAAGPVGGEVALAGDALVAVDHGGVARALRLEDGEPLWTRDLGGRLECRPLPFEGLVLVADRDQKVHALDLQTGEIRWTRPVPSNVDDMSLSADGGTAYLCTAQNGVVAWRLRSSAEEIARLAREDAPPGEITATESFVDIGEVRLPVQEP